MGQPGRPPLPTSEQKERLTCTLDPGQLAVLRVLARERRHSVSLVVREALHEYIERQPVGTLAAGRAS